MAKVPTAPRDRPARKRTMATHAKAENAPLPAYLLRRRNLPASAAFRWLAAGWRDLWHSPLPSLAYGLAVFLVSLVVIWGLFQLQLDYILLDRKSTRLNSSHVRISYAVFCL